MKNLEHAYRHNVMLRTYMPRYQWTTANTRVEKRRFDNVVLTDGSMLTVYHNLKYPAHITAAFHALENAGLMLEFMLSVSATGCAYNGIVKVWL